MQKHFKRVSNRPCSYRIELDGYVEEVFRLTFLANDLNHADGAVANFFCFHTSVCEQDEFFRTASELLPQLMIVEFGQLDHNFHWEKLTIVIVKSKREYRQYGWNRFFLQDFNPSRGEYFCIDSTAHNHNRVSEPVCLDLF